MVNTQGNVFRTKIINSIIDKNDISNINYNRDDVFKLLFSIDNCKNILNISNKENNNMLSINNKDWPNDNYIKNIPNNESSSHTTKDFKTISIKFLSTPSRAMQFIHQYII